MTAGLGESMVGSPEILAADLRAATANLSAWVELRAAELASEEVERAEAVADGRCAAYEQAFAAERRRHADVERELRRQIEVMDRQREQHIGGRCIPADKPAT